MAEFSNNVLTNGDILVNGDVGFGQSAADLETCRIKKAAAVINDRYEIEKTTDGEFLALPTELGRMCTTRRP